MKKNLSIFLAMLLIVTAFAGCGDAAVDTDTGETPASTETSQSTQESDEPRDPLEFSATLVSWGADNEASQAHAAWLETCEEMLNREINIDLTYIPNAEHGEKAKLLLSTNDITDFFALPVFQDWTGYAADGMFLDLMPYEDKLPNYLNQIDLTKGGRTNVYTDDGKFYLLWETSSPRFPQDTGINPQNVTAYNYTVFEENNIEIPGTLDELYEAAKTLKEIYPDNYPINTNWNKLDSIFYAYHTDKDLYWDGSEYKYGPLDEAFKEALQYLNKLYVEELLDPEYGIDTPDIIKEKALTEKNYITLAQWFTFPGDFTRETNEEIIFASTFFPSNPDYGEAWQIVSPNNHWSVAWSSDVISSQVEDIDGLLEFVDLQYSDEITELVTWGMEGVTYEKDADGNNVFVDEILNAENPWEAGDTYGIRTSTSHRPGMQLSQDTKAFVALAKDDYLWYEGDLHVEPFEKSEYYLDLPANIDNEIYHPSFWGPTPQFTTEENQTIANEMTPVKTYVSEMITGFIKGTESFDEWDSFIAEVESLGDIDAVLEIYNGATE